MMQHVNTSLARQLMVALLCMGATANVFAQTGSGNKSDDVNEEVVVVKEYEATVQDAQKINIPPNIPEVEEKTPKLTYSIPAKDLKNFAFEPNALKPIAMAKEKLEKFNSSYIKVGFGSQIMPIAQLAYNDNKTKNLKFGIYYNHLSAMDYKNKFQRFSDDNAGVYLKYYPKRFMVGFAFDFDNNRRHFYAAPEDSFKRKQLRQVFRTYDGQVFFSNAQKNKIEIDIYQNLGFNYLQETYGKGNEWYVYANTDFVKRLKKVHSILAGINVDVSRLKNDSITLNRSIYTIAGGYGYNNDDWKAHAKAGITVFGSKPYFFADIHFEKRLYEHMLIAYTTYNHRLQKNSLNTLAHTNNFIHNWVEIKNTLNGDWGIGLKGTMQNFNYNAAFHLNHIKNMPLFINDSLDTKRFKLIYENNMLIYNGHFELGYNIKEWLRLSFLGDYNHFDLDSNAYAWHNPAFRATIRANYVWKNKISLTVDLFGMSNSKALWVDGSTRTIKGTVDANIGINYLFNKHVSFWGMINNIANQKYQNYYLYPSFGINGAIGAKFSF